MEVFFNFASLLNIKHEMDKKMKYWEIWLYQSLNFLREKKKKIFVTKLKCQGTCILKQQGDSRPHLLEWQKSMIRLTLNPGSHIKPLLFLAGMQNGAAMLEDVLAVSWKTKHPLIIWSSNCASWCLPKGHFG